MTDPHHGVAAGSSAQHYASPPRIVEPGVSTDDDHAGRATTTDDVDPDAPADLLVSHLIADLRDLRERVLRLERITEEFWAEAVNRRNEEQS